MGIEVPFLKKDRKRTAFKETFRIKRVALLKVKRKQGGEAAGGLEKI